MPVSVLSAKPIKAAAEVFAKAAANSSRLSNRARRTALGAGTR